ncbi:HlyU family transcriptional regulator [Kushneria sp. AK178]
MLKKLFDALKGSGGATTADDTSRQVADTVEYKGCEIIITPAEAGGQYRVSGIIRRTRDDGETQELRFERSDVLPDRDSCIDMTRTKAERYIDEQGDRLFEDPHRPN